ncbi:hypothetical protein EJ02DRAFT_464605 [Clathrospora elynae]|uniref:Uncharacterized protein n=1 Tax=Clathrospora elynae TaxID=706981 RepID=A0A6A5SUI9_9PLEO|nr:hypothetical protein EJ02DRAFT_464605 [Clathrospora elynae]
MFVQNKREVAARKEKAESVDKKASKVAADTQAPAAELVAMTQQAFAAALDEAFTDSSGLAAQHAMCDMAAYMLMFEENLLQEEEDEPWPWLREGDTKNPRYPANRGRAVGYSLQMHLLYQSHGASTHSCVWHDVDLNVLCRPTGEPPAAMEN